jgi:hypothetical protein
VWILRLLFVLRLVLRGRGLFRFLGR